MRSDEEPEHLRQENIALRHALQRKDEELDRSLKANQDLREGLKEAISAIKNQQERVKELEGVITSQQERLRTLEGQLAKDSHNSSLPPSSDRFVRARKQFAAKERQETRWANRPSWTSPDVRVQTPDEVLIHSVEQCEYCQHDLRAHPAEMPERRQVIDLPVKRLWVTEHRVEEKQCPLCSHLTRAAFPAGVKAPAQYGRGIQTLATYLV